MISATFNDYTFDYVITDKVPHTFDNHTFGCVITDVIGFLIHLIMIHLVV